MGCVPPVRWYRTAEPLTVIPSTFDFRPKRQMVLLLLSNTAFQVISWGFRAKTSLFLTLEVNYLVRTLSPVIHKGLYQGWKQISIHILLIPHKRHETAKFFKIHKTSFDTNLKQTYKHQTNFQRNSRSVSSMLKKKKLTGLGHAGIMDFHMTYRY